MTKQAPLRQSLLALSDERDDWSKARLEWVYSHSRWSNQPHHCLCGQVIKNLCYLVNLETANEALVGCICVKQFIDPEIGEFAERINYTLRQLTTNPNYRDKENTLIEYASENNVINGREYSFLYDIRRKRSTSLSVRQLQWLNDINAKMIAFATTPRKT
jgi:hypothetical protein